MTSLIQLKAQNNTYQFLIGTYTVNTTSKGIYSLNFDAENNKANLILAADSLSNPSFIAFSSDKKFLYAVNESGEQSKVVAFQFDKKTAKLKKINSVSAVALGPCHITCSDSHVFTANYTSGSVCVFERKPDGSLSEAIQFIQHQGKSINVTRQNVPHAHQTTLSPDGKFLLVNDLGTDYLTVYGYDKNAKNDVLTLHDKMLVKPGSGPRHLTFSKNGKSIYLLQELDGTITHLALNKGKLTKMHETTIIRKKDIIAGAADIHIDQKGKFLYATNRGNANDISCFKILKSGDLQFVQQISTSGNGPRNFAITNDNKFILVGNQKTNQIVVFNINNKTGELTENKNKIDLGAPVCILQF
jgi:6-phosphogluconolactonase